METRTVEELIDILTLPEDMTLCQTIAELDARGETLRRAIVAVGARGVAAKAAVKPLLRLIDYHADQVVRGQAVLALGLIEPHWLDDIESLMAIGDERRLIARLDPGVARDYARELVDTISLGDIAKNVAEIVWVEWLIRCHPCVVPDVAAAFARAARKTTRRNAVRDILGVALVCAGRDHPEVVEHLQRLRARRRSALVRGVLGAVINKIEELERA